jgi:hypothetical protein
VVFAGKENMMKFGGWILMIIAWTTILGMAVFCFSRIFKKGAAKKGN